MEKNLMSTCREVAATNYSILCDYELYVVDLDIIMNSWNMMHNVRIPDNKVHGANMGHTGGRQDPGGPHVGHVNLAIWDIK